MDGNNALAGFDGFIKGWNFGQSINEGNEKAADREQARKDAQAQREYQREQRAREKVVQAQQDEDRQRKLLSEQTPEEIRAAREAQSKLLGLQTQKLQNEVGAAESPEEARARRAAELDAKRATIGYTKAQTARSYAEAKDKAGDVGTNKQLAALDYLERNQELYKPENLSAIDRVYQGLSLEMPDKIQPGDMQAAASAMLPLLDKKTEFNGLPIVSKTAIPHFNKEKNTVVMEVAYKLRKPDGTIVDADAGPLRKATQEGTDAVYEMQDDEAMRLLAGHNLIGRDFQKLISMGGVTPQQAVNTLRQQIIEQGGAKGAASAKQITQPDQEKLGMAKVSLAPDVNVNIQAPYGKPIDDNALIVGGVVPSKDYPHNPVEARTLGDAKRIYGLQPGALVAAAPGMVPAGAAPAAPTAQGKPTLQQFIDVARQKGSKMTDAQLQDYYAKNYGQ